MIHVNNISMQYSERMLIKPVSLAVSNNERIGLVGKNGSGKSTLLKILSGEISPQEGKVSYPKDYSIGYLRQDLPAQADRTLMQDVKSCFEEAGKLKAHFKELQKELETREDYESESYLDLIEHFSKTQERLLLLEGENIDKQIELVLTGLGFKRSEFDMPVSTFSGGWRMRIELAKLLLQMPDLLLLDEPTNHLDIHSIIWLEQFLQKYPGSIVLVSHDTTFMNRLCNRILEIEFGLIYDYKAGYKKFLILKEDRMEKSIAAYNNQQKEVAQTKKLIEKFRYKKSKAKFAQTLIRKLEKTEMLEIETADTSSMKFHFPEGIRAGNIVVKLTNISKSFDEKKVLSNVNFELKRGEKVAFIGKNGMGKTTLARIIAGDLEASNGNVEPGYNFELNYFAQLQSGTLDENLTVLDTIDQVATGEMRTKTRSLLGAFLFSGEDVEKKVKVLSGGEKSRLALAKLMLAPSNFLLLDEPTNHLDVASKDILKKAVRNYSGACVIVSHDRDFLEGLTDRVIEFTEEGLKEYLGDINYFLGQNQFDNIRDFELDELDELESHSEKPQAKKSKGGNDYKDRKERVKTERRLKNKAQRLENQVQEKEKEKQPLVDELQTSYNADTAKKYHELEVAIEKLTEEWMAAQEEYELFLSEN
ncbi:MAG: ABC-F family ATP-binding cassette domain-containing protein [Bacteroidetes bacterium]|nr:ABC-F family ATP-binding cassette domain-containing protein [Bacteroidota bacterium]